MGLAIRGSVFHTCTGMETDPNLSWKVLLNIAKWAAIVLSILLAVLVALMHGLSFICLVPEYCR